MIGGDLLYWFVDCYGVKKSDVHKEVGRGKKSKKIYIRTDWVDGCCLTKMNPLTGKVEKEFLTPLPDKNIEYYHEHYNLLKLFQKKVNTERPQHYVLSDSPSSNWMKKEIDYESYPISNNVVLLDHYLERRVATYVLNLSKRSFTYHGVLGDDLGEKILNLCLSEKVSQMFIVRDENTGRALDKDLETRILTSLKSDGRLSMVENGVLTYHV